jgi:hypothetical protein
MISENVYGTESVVLINYLRPLALVLSELKDSVGAQQRFDQAIALGASFNNFV